MNNKIALESLAMDLKRVALGHQRGSAAMAQRFYNEALQRIAEINQKELRSYLRNVLKQIPNLGSDDSEHTLVYSTLIQNYTQKFL